MESKRQNKKSSILDTKKNSPVHTLDNNNDKMSLNSIMHVNSLFSNSSAYMLDILLNNHSFRFEVDSGSKFTVISESDYKKMQPYPVLKPTDVL